MVSVNIDVRVPMRDGVGLSTDIYRPSGGGPFPTLLLRTIYDNQEPVYIEWTRRFVEAGYAVVMQDCRGRFDSEGQWEPYVHEAEDGYDTQQWIGAQPWCDGNVGMFGVSYPGFAQTQTAPLRSPYVKGIVPIASQQDNFGYRPGGALALHSSLFFGIIAGRTVHRPGFGLLDWDALYSRNCPSSRRSTTSSTRPSTGRSSGARPSTTSGAPTACGTGTGRWRRPPTS